MSASVNDQMVSEWGITKEQLFGQAMKNMMKANPPILTHIVETLALFGSSFLGKRGGGMQNNILLTGLMPECTELPLYVLSNESYINGAVTVLYPGVMEKVNELFPQGVHILPSSRHETLLVPKDFGTVNCLREIVGEVNRTEVSPEDFLSDQVYEFDREHGTLCLAQDPPLKIREMER